VVPLFSYCFEDSNTTHFEGSIKYPIVRDCEKLDHDLVLMMMNTQRKVALCEKLVSVIITI
jgi:hypothetical protein